MKKEIKKPYHIGNRLKKYVTDNRLSRANWARAQGIIPRQVFEYFKNENMRVSTLFTICGVLQYNFIREIADQLPADLPPHTINPLQQRVDELEKENEKLREQVALLREVAGLKKV